MPDYQHKLWVTFSAKDDAEAAELGEIAEYTADRHVGRAIRGEQAERGNEPGDDDTSVTVAAEGEPERLS
jgi:hypothetical protein